LVVTRDERLRGSLVQPKNHSAFQKSLISSLAAVSTFLSGVVSAACIDTNTCFGTDALESNTTGNQNCAFGYRALAANTTGVQNAAFGFEALAVNWIAFGRID